MKVKMLEKVLHGREAFKVGDVRTVDEELGKNFCDNGWAEDESGNYPTTPRDPHKTVSLNVQNVRHGHSAGEANG